MKIFYVKLFLFITVIYLFMFYGLKDGIREEYSVEMWGYFLLFFWSCQTIYLTIKIIQEFIHEKKI